MGNREQYMQQQADIQERAAAMRGAILDPVIDQGSGRFIDEKSARVDSLSKAFKGSVFEGCGERGPLIQTIASNAARKYCQIYGVAPSDDLLAAAHRAVENTMRVGSGDKVFENSIFESADLSTTEGILMRERMVALILPAMLNSIASRIVSYIPGTFNQSEIFKIWRVAGSTFGDLESGDIIDQDFDGQYSSMDQRHLAGTGDGSDTGSSNEFDFDSDSEFGAAQPFKKKSIKIYHDRSLVAVDDGAGNLHGSFHDGAQTVTVTGTVTYATGIVHPLFSVAPALGIPIHIGFDVDIEKDPSLIPLISQEMDSRVLYPHESAIAADVTIQALWAMRREFNINSENMAMNHMRNFLSAEMDRKILRDLRFFLKGERTWDMTIPGDQYYHEHYETLRHTLLEIDTVLMARTKTSGLVGLIVDSKTSVVIRSLKQPFFEPAPDYRRVPQPHYVGRLFGMWDVYEDPAATDYESVAFARGRGIGEAAYLAGTCVAPLTFKHNVLRDLVAKSTLWTLEYRDLQPFDGREYLIKLRITSG